jgi:hypothetical protein
MGAFTLLVMWTRYRLYQKYIRALHIHFQGHLRRGSNIQIPILKHPVLLLHINLKLLDRSTVTTMIRSRENPSSRNYILETKQEAILA